VLAGVGTSRYSYGYDVVASTCVCKAAAAAAAAVLALMLLGYYLLVGSAAAAMHASEAWALCDTFKQGCTSQRYYLRLLRAQGFFILMLTMQLQ
jgi:hypothetical protein